jgi:flagellar hook-length control protein FliK
MQVNPASPAVVNPPAGSTRETLLSNVVQLLAPSSETRARHEHDLERRGEKLRRRDSQQHEVAAQAANAPRPSEQIFRAERDLAPGSHAARDLQLHGRAQEQMSPKPGGFRRVLVEAEGRGVAEHFPTTTRDSGPSTAAGEPDTPASGRAEAGTPAKPADSGTPSTAPTSARAGTTAPAGNPRPAAVGLTATSPARAGGPAAASPTGVRVLAIGRVATSGYPGAPGVGGPRAASINPVAVAMSRAGPASAKTTPRQSAPAEPEPRTSDANLERILRFIQTRIGRERSTAVLRLEPPELGTVRLRMELRDQQLSLDVQTRTAAARQLLSDQVETLRRSLEAAGIHLERVEIRAPAASPAAADAHSSPHTGAWTSSEGSSPGHDGGSAGGSLPGQTESAGAEAADQPVEAAFWEPVAESLVNVLA